MNRDKFTQLILSNPYIENYLCNFAVSEADDDEDTTPLIDRVIYLDDDTTQSCSKRLDLCIDSTFLPAGTKEVLWVHPINLDFSEVLSRVRTKENYEKRLLYSIDGHVETVKGLPQISETEAIESYSMLVSSIEFDHRQDNDAIFGMNQ